MNLDMDRLRDFFAGEQTVCLAYLFGSYAVGREHSLSDIDLAVLLDETIAPAQYGVCQLDLMVKLSALLQQDHIDLVLLNDSPPLLTYEVVRTAKRLFARDESQRIIFEVRAMRDYFDTEYLRRIHRLYWTRWKIAGYG